MKAIIGTKVGMTQVFAENGKKVPVTVIYVEPNQVLSVKTTEKDGYNATQVGYWNTKEQRLTKPELGFFKKVNSEPKRYVRELRDVVGYEVGSKIDCSIFQAGDLVDVQAFTKGHGFTGSIKRHNFSMGPMGHGAGYPHRYTGSIAFGRGGSQGQRVIKGTKMPGHYGHELVTTRNVVVVNSDTNNNIILIKGSVPGPKNGLVKIKTSVMKPNSKVEMNIVNYKNKNSTSTQVSVSATESIENNE